jgi:hypothetical protein
MPTITVGEGLAKVQTILQDTTSVRWTEAELLGWWNDGQREICTIRPDACTKIGSYPTVAGTRQEIPSEGTAIIKVIRNMGTTGTTPGYVIRKVPMDLLDSTIPTWHVATTSAVALHYMVDPRMPRIYYLYPPATGTAKVEMLYAAPPSEIPSVTASATYVQAGTTITVTEISHGRIAGSWLRFTPSTGTALRGTYAVVTAPTADTYTITSTASATTSGIATVNSVISVDDPYLAPLIDYTCFRAYTKDNDLIANKERAASHHALFMGTLSNKSVGDAMVNQTKDNIPG